MGTRIKIKLIFVFTAILLSMFGVSKFADAAGATLYLSPGAGSFLVGSTFDVSIILGTGDMSVNTVEVELKFPADKIQLVNPSVGRSIIQIWATQPVFSNKEGKIYFVGGIPSPGIKTSQGIITTMTFRVVAPGSGQMQFLEKNSVLANDGFGTNILREPKGAYFNFNVPPPVGPRISSPTHPDETRWYKDPNPTLIWTRDLGITGFSYSIDNDPNGFPDTKEDTTASQVSFEALESGLWYFHLRARADGVWGGTSHYVLQIDTDIPAAFQVNVSPGKRTTTRNPILRFFTTDSASGFDHFELKVVPLKLSSQEATPFFFEVSSPYQLTPLQPGRYTVIVRAFDKAGNWRDEEAQLNIISSFFQFFTSEGIDFVFFFAPWSLLLIILALVIALIIIITVILWWLHHPHIKGHAKEDFEKLRGFISRKPRSSDLLADKAEPPPVSVILSGSEESQLFDSAQGKDSLVVPLPKELPQNDITEIREAEPAIMPLIPVVEKRPESEFLFPPKMSKTQSRLQSAFLSEKSVPPPSNEAPGLSKLKEKIRFIFGRKPAEVEPMPVEVEPPSGGSTSQNLETEEIVAKEPSIREILEAAEELKAPVLPPALSEARLDRRPESLKPSPPSPSKKREYPALPFHSLYSWLLRKNGPFHLPGGGLN